MKVASHSRQRKPKLNLQAQIFTLSMAKTYLGRLTDKASQGEPVYILRGQKRFLLQEVPEIEPIPIRPAGFFAGCYSQKEIAEANRLAKASIIRAPQDLE